MSLLILALLLALCLVLIPFGVPGGIWLLLAVGLGFDRLTGGSIGWATLIGSAVLILVAEGFELAMAARVTRRFGGSRRAAWGAIIGGFLGTLVGVPVPFIGSVIGGFVGAFVGALAAELSHRDHTASPTRVATGALVGRAAGTAIKSGFGFAIATWLLIAAWR